MRRECALSAEGLLSLSPGNQRLGHKKRRNVTSQRPKNNQSHLLDHLSVQNHSLLTTSLVAALDLAQQKLQTILLGFSCATKADQLVPKMLITKRQTACDVMPKRQTALTWAKREMDTSHPIVMHSHPIEKSSPIPQKRLLCLLPADLHLKVPETLCQKKPPSREKSHTHYPTCRHADHHHQCLHYLHLPPDPLDAACRLSMNLSTYSLCWLSRTRCGWEVAVVRS